MQFTDDPDLRAAVLRAESVRIAKLTIRVLRAADLLHAKLRAAGVPARRRSKRIQDLADAQALVERDRSLEASLTPPEKALLARLPI